MNENTSIPWVEKYRPSELKDIVLDEINSNILNSIIQKEHFPNLLLYGPPGTGKTTTIINLIKSYQEKMNNVDSKMVIHLNASDDRGIDIIRNQISQFVNSKSLFNSGLKYVVLDEADYMTKNAQQALHNLLETVNENVRFCLICNYISKIELSLQSEFIHMRFNKLPEQNIIDFLNKIVKEEDLKDMNKVNIKAIQDYYKNDIRSMINFLQVDKKNRKTNIIIDNNCYNEITDMIKKKLSYKKIESKIMYYSTKYKMEKFMIIKKYLKFLVDEKNIYEQELIDMIELSYHSSLNHSYNETYIIIKLQKIISNLDTEKYSI